METFKDWKNLLISIAHKTGDIYDLIMYIINSIKAFKDIEENDDKLEWCYKVAIYFGLAIKAILDHPPADFYIKDPADAYPAWNSF